MKKKRWLPLSVLITMICSASALAMDTQWQAQHFQDEHFDLPYQIYHPQSAEKLPLVIHLHGTGEAGIDNQAQLYKGQHIGPDYFTNDDIQAIQKAIVLAPQTPDAIRWASTSIEPYDFSSTPSTPSMTALLELVDHLLETDPSIDASRVYLTGLSRGGQGVWNAALQRPDFFAAIVPIAGSASPADAKRLVNLPIWTFHGDKDTTTNVAYTRAMVDAILQAGGTTNNIRYTEVAGGEHADSWLAAFKDEQLYRWLLTHQRK